MTATSQLIESSPVPPQFDAATLAACIDACSDCARACLICADACMAEPKVPDLLGCIRLDNDCADICATTGRLVARQYAIDPALLQAMVQTCISATKLCAEECGSHAEMHEHCRLCAEACRRCEAACRELLAAII
jgi:hypothetical protein